MEEVVQNLDQARSLKLPIILTIAGLLVSAVAWVIWYALLTLAPIYDRLDDITSVYQVLIGIAILIGFLTGIISFLSGIAGFILHKIRYNSLVYHVIALILYLISWILPLILLVKYFGYFIVLVPGWVAVVSVPYIIFLIKSIFEARKNKIDINSLDKAQEMDIKLMRILRLSLLIFISILAVGAIILQRSLILNPPTFS
jgi:hypothetical protein